MSLTLGKDMREIQVLFASKSGSGCVSVSVSHLVYTSASIFLYKFIHIRERKYFSACIRSVTPNNSPLLESSADIIPILGLCQSSVFWSYCSWKGDEAFFPILMDWTVSQPFIWCIIASTVSKTLIKRRLNSIGMIKWKLLIKKSKSITLIKFKCKGKNIVHVCVMWLGNYITRPINFLAEFLLLLLLVSN